MFILCRIAIVADETNLFICDQTLRLLPTLVGLLVPASAGGTPLFFCSSNCAHDRCALQQLALNVQLNTLTMWPKRKLPFAQVCLSRHWADYWYITCPMQCMVVVTVVHIVGCMMYDRCVSSVVHIVGCMMYDRCVLGGAHCGLSGVYDVWQVCVLGGAHCVCWGDYCVAVITLWGVWCMTGVCPWWCTLCVLRGLLM